MTSRYLHQVEKMPRLHLANLVVAFLIRNARTTTLDLLARVSVLEGVAGVKPGTWMRDKVPKGSGVCPG